MTPSDTETLPVIPSKILFSHPGNYRLTFEGGQTVDVYFKDYWTFFEARITQIHATGSKPNATITVFW
ncbi:MAG: hypothetical protein RLN94_08130 [Roseovarius sp.]|uniref:spike base protein, RCAP_Rcc01079 family n=1 Tax=Roseovarius sp. TaxID=1486281 RepID=UPI0032EC7EEB